MASPREDVSLSCSPKPVPLVEKHEIHENHQHKGITNVKDAMAEPCITEHLTKLLKFTLKVEKEQKTVLKNGC